MKGKELIKMIEDYDLQDFNLVIHLLTEEDPKLTAFDLDNVPYDISYFDKICILSVTKQT